mgnify:CR=1 FL=1
MRVWYALIYSIVWPFFNLVHPGRAVGREHIPEGGVLVCGNHTAMSDPLFLAFAFRLQHQLRPMAKAELLRANHLRLPRIAHLMAILRDRDGLDVAPVGTIGAARRELLRLLKQEELL